MAANAAFSPPVIASPTILLPACTSGDPEERALEALRRQLAVSSLHRHGAASGAEMVRSICFTQKCLAQAAALGPYLQPTNEQLAAQMAAQTAAMVAEMAAQTAAINAQMAAQTAATISMNANITRRFTGIKKRLKKIEARQRNAAAMHPTDALTPVPHGDNPPPTAFPATREALTSMTVANSNILLAYYELLAEGDAAAKRHRLFLHLGLRFRNVDGM
jgi:hypothetical protein